MVFVSRPAGLTREDFWARLAVVFDLLGLLFVFLFFGMPAVYHCDRPVVSDVSGTEHRTPTRRLPTPMGRLSAQPRRIQGGLGEDARFTPSGLPIRPPVSPALVYSFRAWFAIRLAPHAQSNTGLDQDTRIYKARRTRTQLLNVPEIRCMAAQLRLDRFLRGGSSAPTVISAVGTGHAATMRDTHLVDGALQFKGNLQLLSILKHRVRRLP